MDLSFFYFIFAIAMIPLGMIITSPLIVHIVLWGLLIICVFGHRIPGFSIPQIKWKIIRIVLYIAFCGMLVYCVCGRSWIPGIFYPSKQYRIIEMEVKPPLDIIFVYGKGDNSFEQGLNALAYTDKEYKIIRIKKILYEWDGNIGEFLNKREVVELKPHFIEHGFKDGWYKDVRVGSFFRKIEFGKFNPEKLFKGKKIGDKFKLCLTVVYSFDGEPEETVTLGYDVEVIKGKYQPSFTGF